MVFLSHLSGLKTARSVHYKMIGTMMNPEYENTNMEGRLND